MNTPAPRRPVVVVRGLSARDIAIIVVILAVIVGFLIAALGGATKKPRNTLSGVITGRESTGVRETELAVGSRGVKGRTADTGFYLSMFVAEENRTYRVMVERELWEAKKIGERLDFLRPVEEQE